MITILNKTNSIFNQYLAEIRDKDVQQDRFRFRRNLERMGEIMAYEISKNIPYVVNQINTPLGIAEENILAENPVIASIMRAGLPIHHGMLNIFDRAPNGFIAAFRNYDKDGTFNIKIDYISCPETKNRILILADAMLATGSSMELAYRALIERGAPQHTYIVAIIASKEGVNYLLKKLPSQKVSIWVGALDDELTVKSFIVPGLGDAGDLAFGENPL